MFKLAYDLKTLCPLAPRFVGVCFDILRQVVALAVWDLTMYTRSSCVLSARIKGIHTVPSSVPSSQSNINRKYNLSLCFPALFS